MSWKQIVGTLGLVGAGLAAIALGQPMVGATLIGTAIGLPIDSTPRQPKPPKSKAPPPMPGFGK